MDSTGLLVHIRIINMPILSSLRGKFGIKTRPSAAVVAPGQVQYTTAGTYSWVVPAGVTTISAVLVGPGGAAFLGVNGAVNAGGGGGAGLRYINDLPVTPGETLTIIVGTPSVQTSTTAMTAPTSTFLRRGTSTLVQADPGGTGGRTITSSTTAGGGGGGGGTAFGTGPFGGTIGGGNGGAGGSTRSYRGSGGGGAGGYSGNGGNGGSYSSLGVNNPAGTNGTGGGGAGGSAAYNANTSTGGGGVGILGQGNSGTIYGGAGSGGTGPSGRVGGGYGGGAAGYATGWVSGPVPGAGGPGAARIIWGTGRAFPATNTGDL